MKIELLKASAAAAESEILAVFAADGNASRDPDATPQISLLTTDEAATVLTWLRRDVG